VKLLINLYSQVNSFSGQGQQFEPLIKIFGESNCVLVESKKEFLELLPQAEAVLCWSFTPDLYSLAENLKLLVTPAAGRDWIAEDPSGQVQVEFSSFHGPMIAESFLSMMLCFNNQFTKQLDLQRSRVWDRNVCVNRRLLSKQKLLIVGYGSIAAHCASLAQKIGLDVCGVNRSGEGDIPILTMDEMYERLTEFDHVLSLLPGTPENDRVLGRRFFTALKGGTHFYNFGRGTVVDEDSLIEFLATHSSSFAGLDVTYHEPLAQESVFYEHKQVLLTPHNSCTYEEYLPLFVEEFKSRFELGQFPSLKA
jgi:D-2-hydroxyacid dehydrogenase (NADP+)